ncbi:hypothetical protein AKJ38_03815 [candidate division MSBL1 archaeon SCGC-AAA259I14]|uniref:Transcription factor TFIIB cyclin-like domain-containing protein n=1 Tax=candidate division MSBL1 archaeon SCGC-AAA259I14 TaxID=1698268 RepID=A0A133UPR2_9EURY|nr:hypothetical protein AKJ38_03815 [candidate division MSBL1 archaeon SCGC-AAA259I14]
MIELCCQGTRVGSELNISGEAKVEAMRIIRKAQEEKLTSGKSPPGIAAAAIYIASLKCGERRTQEFGKQPSIQVAEFFIPCKSNECQIVGLLNILILKCITQLARGFFYECNKEYFKSV